MGKWKAVAVALVVLSIIAAAPVIVGRQAREQHNRGVDLVLEYRALRTLARSENYDLPKFLRELKDAGVTGIALQEQTIETLQELGDLQVMDGRDLRRLVNTVPGAHPDLVRWVKSNQISDLNTYLTTPNAELARQLASEVRLRLPEGRASLLEPATQGGLYAVQLGVPRDALVKLGLGFDAREFQDVLAAGLRPVLRPRNYANLAGDPSTGTDRVSSIFAEMDKLAGGQAKTVVFEGNQVLGYPKALGLTAQELQQRGWTVGLIEHSTQLAYADQAGQDQLASDLGYRTTRVYAIGQAEVDHPDFTASDTVDKWWRAVVDRNIRILYLRPFKANKSAPGDSVITTNLKAFASLKSLLETHGYTAGEPGTFALAGDPVRLQDVQTVHTWQFLLMGLGVLGGFILWLLLVREFDDLTVLSVLVLGFIGVALCKAGSRPTFVAVGAACIFPALAGTLLLRRWRAWYMAVRDRDNGPASKVGAGALVREVLVAMAIMALVSAIGGILVGASMGGIQYLLEFSPYYFKGVKVAFMVPLLLVMVAYFMMGRRGSFGEVVAEAARDLRSLAHDRITYGAAFLAALAAGAAFVYLQRSGNFPIIPVPGLELKMRTFLEHTLVARPREKEFIIGYPLLAWAVVAYLRNRRAWVIPLLIGATTGGVSIVNSFSHLRTPFETALMRGVHGFWLGIITSLIAAAAGVLVATWVEGALSSKPGAQPRGQAHG